MKVGLCAIAKNEDMYVDHWVKHYFDRGFDAITIYDNNDEKDLVCKDKRVEIINIHGKETAQFYAYKDYLKKYKNKFDWIAYFDLDEFLDCENIKEVLSKLPSNINQMQIKCMNMSDNGYVKADYSKSPFERFTTPALSSENIVKSICKSKEIKKIISSHFNIENFTNTCFSNGKPCNVELKRKFKKPGPFAKEDYDSDEIIMHHCDMKTIEEYIKHKFARTDAIFKDMFWKAKIIPDRCFFMQNKKTLEKLKILSKAPYNGFIDLILGSEKEYTEDLLNKYRKIYIKDLKGDMGNNRVLALKNRDPIDVRDLAEFYIEDGIEKRKSLGQIKKYFS